MEKIKNILQEMQENDCELLDQKLADCCLQELQRKRWKMGVLGASVEPITIKELIRRIKKDVLEEKEEEIIPHIKKGLIGIFLGGSGGNIDPYKIPIKIDWWFYGERNFKRAVVDGYRGK